MRFAVIGLGGAGGYFGARLVEAGHDVTFIARGDHLAAIRRSGLRVDSVNGDVVAIPAQVTDDPREVAVVDHVIMGVKAWQVAEATRAVAPLVGPRTAILPLQNGVEAAEQIASVIQGDHALGGTARIISVREGPGHIRHVGADPTLEIGELDGSRSPRVQALQAAFAQTRGVTIAVPPSIRAAMWAKFLFIASWSGVGAVTRAPVGILRSMPETRALLAGAMEEIAQIARVTGIDLSPDVVPETMAYLDRLPAQGTASMQRDIAEGKASELDALSGAVTRLGLRMGVPTPIHAFLYHSLLPLARRARAQVEF